MSAPAPPSSDPAGLAGLLALLQGRRIVVLAGAGCSTESGIPDYRGPTGSRRARAPVRYQEFVGDAGARRRYWARSTVGWRRVAAARPNAGHVALARLEEAGVVRGVITQNVDGLHQAAGSRRVVELHGSLGRVRCLACDAAVTRASHQARLEAANRGWPGAAAPATSRPDGDAELDDRAWTGFRVPGCEACGGLLKPDVVFFGENVPKARVEAAWRLFEEGDVLLVVGSSLTVFSGRRFTYRAAKEGVPIGIVNLGPTRADAVATAKVEAPLGRVLPAVAEALTG